MRNTTISILILITSACAPDIRPGGGGGNTRRDGGTAARDLGSTPGPGPGIDPGPVDDGCSEEAKLVYVVDVDNRLSSFVPSTLQFTEIGTLNCPAEAGATPFSMSLDRSATAWVLYSSGQVFKVDTTDARCSATSFQRNQQGLEVFGMGFVADAAGSSDEKLYIAGGPADLLGLTGSTLATLDTNTLRVRSIGDIDGNPELTGTGDAKLWGFFPDDVRPRVAELDQQTGASGQTFALSSLAGSPLAWAFAFWGGDFWVFLQRDSDPSTRVYRVNGRTGTSQVVISNTGRQIVGAGVSTCAPITISERESLAE